VAVKGARRAPRGSVRGEGVWSSVWRGGGWTRDGRWNTWGFLVGWRWCLLREGGVGEQREVQRLGRSIWGMGWAVKLRPCFCHSNWYSGFLNIKFHLFMSVVYKDVRIFLFSGVCTSIDVVDVLQRSKNIRSAFQIRSRFGFVLNLI